MVVGKLPHNSSQFLTKSVFISKLAPKSHFSIFFPGDNGNCDLQDKIPKSGNYLTVESCHGNHYFYKMTKNVFFLVKRFEYLFLNFLGQLLGKKLILTTLLRNEVLFQ